MQSHIFFVLYQRTLILNQDSQSLNTLTLTKYDIQITMRARWHITNFILYQTSYLYFYIPNLLTLSLLLSSLHHHK